MASSTSRSADRRAASSQRGAGQWLLGLLIVLALVASVMMVWSDQLSVRASVAVIAALWAAVLGAIGIARFRRQAEIAEAKSRDLRLVYELQLEREIAARRQYETDIEAQIRREVAAEATSDLRDLQAQIAALRATLESVMGRELPDERVAALTNERLHELSSMPSYTNDDGLLAATDFASTAPPSADGRHLPPQGGRDDLTEIIPVVEDDVDVDAPFVDYTEYSEPEPATDAWVVPSAGETAGGRRRSEGQHESGISAAELLSQLRGDRAGEDPHRHG